MYRVGSYAAIQMYPPLCPYRVPPDYAAMQLHQVSYSLPQQGPPEGNNAATSDVSSLPIQGPPECNNAATSDVSSLPIQGPPRLCSNGATSGVSLFPYRASPQSVQQCSYERCTILSAPIGPPPQSVQQYCYLRRVLVSVPTRPPRCGCRSGIF